MRLLYVLLAALLLSSAQTQGSYIGVGGAFQASSDYASTSLLSLHVGGPAAPGFGGLEGRVTFDTILVFSSLGLDLLASVRPPGAPLRLYVGGGPNLLFLTTSHSAPGEAGLPFSLGLHGTAGLELAGGVLTGGVRPFAELQPAATFLNGNLVYGLRGRAGLNFFF